jgi:hypothetical protein
MPVLSYVHQRFRAGQCQAYFHTRGWKDRRLHVPAVIATTSAPGARITTGRGSNATTAKAVGGPATTLPTRCRLRANGHSRIGSAPPLYLKEEMR